MASFSSYPTGSDVAALLESAGLEPGNSAELDNHADIGRELFEGPQGANRKMLASATATLRTFTIPDTRDGVIYLPDLAAAPTSVAWQPVGASSTALVLGTDYNLHPENAIEEGHSISGLVLYNSYPYYGAYDNNVTYRGALKVTGRWGYFTALPAGVYQAMAMLGAASLAEAARLGETGGLLGWSSAGHTAQYGELTLKALQDGWEARGYAVAKKYRKVSL